MVAPGVTTMDLERAAEKKIRELGAKPAFKGYYDYPCVLCTSVNEEIVHGIPSEKRVLKAGDIVSIDCGVVLDGYYGDSAITVPVGESQRRAAEAARSDAKRRCTQAIEQVADRQHGRRCRRGGAAVCGSQRDSAWCASLSGTGSAPSCTKSRRCRTTASRGRRQAARRHGAGDRADGEVGQSGNAGAERQVDSSDRRRQLQRSL